MGLMRSLLLVILIMLTACGGARTGETGPEPVFSPQAGAALQVDTALAEAGRRGVNALVIFGAQWCHDSRGLVAEITGEGTQAALVAEHYALAFIYVGQRDANLDQLARFGVEWMFGTPTVLVVSPDGVLLNAQTVHDWRMAHSAAHADLGAYLARYSRADPPAGAAHAGIDLIVSQWPPLRERLSEIAAGEDDAPVRARRTAYATGYARSRVRALMGDWEAIHGPIADSAALPDRDPGLDRTEEIAALLSEIDTIAPERFTATGPD